LVLFFKKEPLPSPRRTFISRTALRRLSVALGLAGLAAGTLLIGYYGFGQVLGATASVGPAGFLAVCAWQMVIFAILGLSWFALLPPAPHWRLPVLTWGRMVRDAAGQLLPFSLVGGFVLGARAVTLHGVPWPRAVATTVVDLTTELMAQMILVLIGLFLLAARAPHAPLLLPVSIGLAVTVCAAGAFVWSQHRGAGLLLRLSRRLLGSALPSLDGTIETIYAAMGALYATPWRIALGTLLHLVGWFGTGVASFIAFRLLGAAIDFPSALGIEALLHAVLAGAILVPAYAGVQEAAYAAVGALFGQTAELSLAVSLLRRARDIALGVPILLIWQFIEVRRRRGAL
jgi:putative membrane protein